MDNCQSGLSSGGRMQIPLFARKTLRVDVPRSERAPTMRADRRKASAAKWLTTRRAGSLARGFSEMQFFVADEAETIAAEPSLAERRLRHFD